MKKSIIRDLESAVRGEVLVCEEVRRLYSVDASAYQVVPDVVVVPRDEDDVVGAVLVARETGTPVTPRGGGTGLVGGALNTGIILDMKNLDSIRVEGNRVVAGVGATRGQLDRVLGERNKMFGPNPSVGPFCSVGGMLANNSGGSRSLKYGCVIDNVTAVRFVDGNGRRITLPGDLDVGRQILKLASLAEMERFPRVSKNSSGYRLDRVGSIGETHRLLVGSEGTLGVILSAELAITDLPGSRALFVVGYGSVDGAMSDCPRITATGPSALEFIDGNVLAQMRIDGVGPDIGCVLLVEYDGNIPERSAALGGAASGVILAESGDEKEMARWWNRRNAALHHSMTAVRKDRRTPHVVDDAAVPPERVRDLFRILDGINRRYNTRTITFGHAGDGNVHAHLVMDNTRTETIKRIAGEYCREINQVGGTITAEHGDGFASTEFVRGQYGGRNHELFVAAKALLDPSGILNPGKIISRGSTVVSNLVAVDGAPGAAS